MDATYAMLDITQLPGRAVRRIYASVTEERLPFAVAVGITVAQDAFDDR